MKRQPSARCEACGQPLATPRSLPQHNRFFALCDKAYLHWPDDHVFRPRNRDHMRYFLTMKSGRFRVMKSVRVTNRSVDPDKLALLFRAVFQPIKEVDNIFVDVDGDHIVVLKTDSIKFPPQRGAMSQKEFNQLCNDAAEVIFAETGIDPEQLMREHAA